MEHNHLNALRLGFSTQQATQIQRKGLSNFIDDQLNGAVPLIAPNFVQQSPKDIKTWKQELKKAEERGAEHKKELQRLRKAYLEQWKAFVLKRCFETDFPLREKINLFFQNHFVVTLKAVKFPHWIFQHYQTINTYSLGNYKTLVREMVYSNALLKYLDNNQNKNGKVNENLARELLELFTLGEGNYTEEDIKNTARSLAGLSFGVEKGEYIPRWMDKSIKTVFGKSGNYTIDDVIEIIFEQQNTPYFLAKKALKWFFYDNPSQEKIIKYGDVLREHHFELQPFFQTLFKTECKDKQGGHQIKNPLIYFAQVYHDLQLKPNYDFLAFVLQKQGMDIYNQANVKGWQGGQHWLTAQIYSFRNQFIDFIIDGNKRFEQRIKQKFSHNPANFEPTLIIKNRKNARTILHELGEKMLFQLDKDIQEELNQLLSYDFDSTAENADINLLRVYQYLAKKPEFQII